MIVSSRIFILLLIITAIAFFAKWQLGKIPFFKSRRTASYVVSGLIGIMAIVVFAVGWTYYIIRMPQKKFNETIWVNDIQERNKMINDLLESDYLIGQKASHIKAVFGKPEAVNHEEGVLTYTLIGHTALDWKIISLKLFMKDSIVKSFTYDTRIDH